MHGPLNLPSLDETQNCAVAFPIVADADRKVAKLYDMLDQQDKTNVDSKVCMCISLLKLEIHWSRVRVEGVGGGDVFISNDVTIGSTPHTLILTYSHTLSIYVFRRECP